MSRSLAPRELGAYARLGVPLATALLGGTGRPRATALLLTVAAVALFFAHEPVLVLLGRRGARARRADGRAAQLRLLRLLVVVAVGAITLTIAEHAVVVAALVPLALFVVSVALVALHRERTLFGEAVAAMCLASAAMPVAVASGWSLRGAMAALFAWSVGLVVATVAVRAVLRAKKQTTPP